MKINTMILGAGLMTVISAPCLAADLAADAAMNYPHAVVPSEAPWAGAIVLLILGMFAAAVAVGVVVRANALPEVPVAHSHDEPPGTSHHHGPGGTVQPGPEHELPGGHADASGGHH